ncbi:MAG: hypothetical protein ACPLKS_03625 [Caldisericum exile]|uniref:hypothetical protein n=1 Tax=Caldisericum exile TaxID=693075 RepID=UPI003C765D4F
MIDCYATDKTILEQKVTEIINKSKDYISKLEIGGTGKIIDSKEQIFVRFYVTGKTIAIDEVQEQVYVV